MIAAALLVGGVLVLQDLMPLHVPRWWGPPVLVWALLCHVAWRGSAGGAVAAGVVAWAILSARSLQPPLLTALGLAALLVSARQASRVLDVTYWFIQPLVALFALAAAEAFVVANQFLWFGEVAWTPRAIVVATAFAVPLLHPAVDLIARWWKDRGA